MGWLHYFLRDWLGRDIHAPWTYVIGVGLGIGLPFASWCLVYGALVHWSMQAWLPVVAFTCISVTVGFVVMLCYDADQREKARQKAQQDERTIEKGKDLLKDAFK